MPLDPLLVLSMVADTVVTIVLIVITIAWLRSRREVKLLDANFKSLAAAYEEQKRKADRPPLVVQVSPDAEDIGPPSKTSKLVCDVDWCPRCGSSHKSVEFRAAPGPIGGKYTHWGSCVRTYDPILIRATVATEESMAAAASKPKPEDPRLHSTPGHAGPDDRPSPEQGAMPSTFQALPPDWYNDPDFADEESDK